MMFYDCMSVTFNSVENDCMIGKASPTFIYIYIYKWLFSVCGVKTFLKSLEQFHSLGQSSDSHRTITRDIVIDLPGSICHCFLFSQYFLNVQQDIFLVSGLQWTQWGHQSVLAVIFIFQLYSMCNNISVCICKEWHSQQSCKYLTSV